MLTYAVEERGKETLYEYLYRSIRGDILGGKLKAGAPLPSKRALARQLSVSTITVENAYAQLVTEGYVYALPRKGFFVSDLGMTDLGRLRLSGSGGERERTVSSGIPSAGKPGNKSQEQNSYFADFASNQTDPDSFPFSIWAKLSRQVLSDCREELMANPPSGGILRLREAIARHLWDFRALAVEPEQIIVGAGTEYLYGLLIQLLGFDRIYASEEPGYAKPSQVFGAHGVRHVRIPLDEGGLAVGPLECSGAQVVHVTPSHHFPTGITMPASRRYELLRWAAREPERYIIEDDYDSEFRMNGRPLPALLGAGDGQRVIYMNTFTKSLASTIRVSYMVLPSALLGRYRERLGFYACTVPTFEQYTLAAFIGEGYFEKHINRMRNASRKKRDALLEQLRESPLQGWCRITEENAGLHFLLTVREDIHIDQFEQSLEEKGIRFRPLSSFYAEPVPWRNRYVMNYSSLQARRIPEAVRRICEAAREAGAKEGGKEKENE